MKKNKKVRFSSPDNGRIAQQELITNEPELRKRGDEIAFRQDALNDAFRQDALGEARHQHHSKPDAITLLRY